MNKLNQDRVPQSSNSLVRTSITEVVAELDKQSIGPASSHALFAGQHTQLKEAVLLTLDGSTARIYKGQFNNTYCAIKLFNTDLAAEDCLREIEMHKTVGQHPNVVRLLSSYMGLDRFMVLELMEGGTLSSKIYNKSPLELPARLAIFCDLLNGLAHVHGLGIVHRDIKCLNILLDNNGRAKIADFGSAIKLTDRVKLDQYDPMRGTPHYLAPEVANDAQACSEKSDIYSCALVLFELVTYQELYNGLPVHTVMYRAMADYNRLNQSLLGDIPLTLPEWVRLIIARGTKEHPLDRPSIQELLLSTTDNQVPLVSKKSILETENYLNHEKSDDNDTFIDFFEAQHCLASTSTDDIPPVLSTASDDCIDFLERLSFSVDDTLSAARNKHSFFAGRKDDTLQEILASEHSDKVLLPIYSTTSTGCN